MDQRALPPYLFAFPAYTYVPPAPGVRPVRRSLRVLAASAAVLLAAPAAAQEFTYNDIPWGSDVKATTAGLARAGFTLDEEFAPDEGELMYVDDEGVFAFATFAGNRLVGVRIAWAGDADNVEDLFASTVEEGVRNMGEPDLEEDDAVSWQAGETAFTVMVAEGGEGPYIALQYAGPGFYEEIERRMAAARAAGYPPLEARWQVAMENESYRTAWDRTTMQRMGNRVFRIWARDDYLDPQADPVQHDQATYQVDLDCAQRRVRWIASNFRMRGELVHSVTLPEPTAWTAAEPESSTESLVVAVCQAAERR